MSEHPRFAGAVSLAAVSFSALLVAAGSAGAQQAAKPAEGSGLERAQRQASNPLRLILEAARIKRRESAELADAGEGAAARRLAARAATVEAQPHDEAAGTSNAAGTAPLGGTDADDRIRVVPALPADLPAVPALEAAAFAEPPLAAASVPALPAVAQPVVQPRPPRPDDGKPPVLVSMVEPALPQHVIDALPRNEVAVDFVIRADGTVAEVTPVPPVPRTLLRPLAEALERWQYEPTGVERRHRVVLVFTSAH